MSFEPQRSRKHRNGNLGAGSTGMFKMEWGAAKNSKECRALSINICPQLNCIPIGTITNPHAYMNSFVPDWHVKTDLSCCISKPKSP